MVENKSNKESNTMCGRNMVKQSLKPSRTQQKDKQQHDVKQKSEKRCFAKMVTNNEVLMYKVDHFLNCKNIQNLQQKIWSKHI